MWLSGMLPPCVAGLLVFASPTSRSRCEMLSRREGQRHRRLFARLVERLNKRFRRWRDEDA